MEGGRHGGGRDMGWGAMKKGVGNGHADGLSSREIGKAIGSKRNDGKKRGKGRLKDQNKSLTQL